MRRVFSLSAVGLTSLILHNPAFAESDLHVVPGYYPNGQAASRRRPDANSAAALSSSC